MTIQHHPNHIDPELQLSWLRARSLARGLPLPVAEHGGWRVDTGLPEEAVRYVYTGPVPRIRDLAAAISAPHMAIKMCGAPEELQALVPSHWQVQPRGYLMTHTGVLAPPPALPAGYRLELGTAGTAGAATQVYIFADDGTLAASGYALEHDGVFIVDRIVTALAHQRRGLGAALMGVLASTQQAPTSRRVLEATEDGLALYVTLGWRVLAPYSTALTVPIPA